MSLFQTISISASGMSAQRVRAQLLAENIANAETTRTDSGGPYRRKDAVFNSAPLEGSFTTAFDSASRAQGVAVSEVVEDTREPERRYLPGHPDANAEGYVAFPRLNAAEEMVDLLNASRGYQANVAAISAVKDMILRSIDLVR